MTTAAVERSVALKEWTRCTVDPAYFMDEYAYIYDASETDWVRFRLWQAQADVLRLVYNNQLVVALKARQLGLTWLMLGYALWLMVFRPVATVSVFSRRQEEADYLLSSERMRGMYGRLPEWMRFPAIQDNSRHWQLSNGSVARSFPTSAGDSYTATFALADEFDLVEDQNTLLQAVRPTVADGGQMVLLSRADKRRPESEFKRLYLSGKRGDGPWVSVFLPWSARPDRDQAWYDAMVQDSMARTGTMDSVHEQYPATDAQALAPKAQDARLPSDWLLSCYDESRPLRDVPGSPAIPGLRVFVPPVPGTEYVEGADPAEGNPTSDDSSASVLLRETGEEAAVVSGKHDPEVFAAYVAEVSRWYNGAPVLVERNNHGHVVLAWLRKNAPDVRLLFGTDGKVGWLTTAASKTQLYDQAATDFREGDAVVHDLDTFAQLSSVSGSTLRAPKGRLDDRAVATVLALRARAMSRPAAAPVVYQPSRGPAYRPGSPYSPRSGRGTLDRIPGSPWGNRRTR